MQIQCIEWGQLDNRKVSQFTLVNNNQMSAKISSYGAILVSLDMPDRNGKIGNVLLGYPSLEGYQTD